MLNLGRMASLKARIRGGESARLEFKVQSPGPLKLARVAASFANGAGGDLVLGVDDVGRITGLEEAETARKDLDLALHRIEPAPTVTVEHHLHDLRDVLVLSVAPLEFPELCYVDEEGDPTLYFRIQKQTRAVDREVERSVLNLRNRFRGRRSLDEDSSRLVSWLWDKGESLESDCASKFNYSSHRLRKLAEDLIGKGYLIPCRMAGGRSYVAIRPAGT